MIAIHPLDAGSVPPFALMARPGLRRDLLNIGADPNLLALGASFWGQPAGVAVVHVGNEAAQLTDLYVLPAYRKAGSGTSLLAAVEEAAQRSGVGKLYTLYRPDEHTPAFERVLAKRGWQPPILSNIVFWTCCAVGAGPWAERFRFRPPYEVFLWTELTDSERSTLLACDKTGDWYSPTFSPFLRPDDAWDPKLSLGLRYKGEVVGWCLVHREETNLVLVDILFVDPPLQRLGRGFMLVGEFIHRYCTGGGDLCYWRVSPENEAMLRWSRKAFDDGKLIIDKYEEWRSEKTLKRSTD